MSKLKLDLICDTKADVTALRQVVVWHDAHFTLARNYQVEAEHNIEYMYNEFLKASLSGKYTKAEMGVEGVRALEQLMGTTHDVFNDKREMIFFFFRKSGGGRANICFIVLHLKVVASANGSTR